MKKISVPVFIFVILSFHIVMNYHIISASRFARIDDEVAEIQNGYDCYRDIKAGDIKSWLRLDPFRSHPHFLSFTQALCRYFLGSYKSANINSMILLTNSLFFFVLLISIYGIGNQLYGRKVGLLSAFLISMFPIVFGHSRIVMLDLPLASMTSLTLYLLLKSRHFSSLTYSLLAGIAFGLAQLTKEAAVIFILPPLIYYFFQSISLKARSTTLRSTFLFLLSFGIIAGTVYLRPDNLHSYGIYMRQIYINNYANELYYYFNNFFTVTGPLILIVCLPLVVSYLINIKHRERLFLYWFLIPFILFSLFPNRAIRFILPLSAPFCLMVTQELFNNVLFKKIRAWYISIIVIIAICQYVLLNSGLLMLKNKDNIGYLHLCGILAVQKDKDYAAYASLFEIFKREAEQNNLKRERNNVVFLFHIAEIEDYLGLNSLGQVFPFRLKIFLKEVDKVTVKNYINSGLEEEVATADYVVDKDGAKDIWPDAKIIEERLRYRFDRSKDRFKIIATIELYDRSHVYVYKRIQ